MTVPMVWAVLAMVSFNFVDTWFVAQLGASELAAMSFTFPVVLVLVSFGIGLMAGTSSVVARSIGAGDHARAQRLTTDALSLALVIALLLAALGFITFEPLFRALGADQVTLPKIRAYMMIWYAGLPVFLVPMAAMGAIRATGETHLQSRIMIGAFLVNVVLDPLLIFGLAGLPRMELAGAALASVLARCALLGVGAHVLHRRLGLLSLRRPGAAALLQSWKALLHVALPAAGTNAIIPLATGFVLAIVAGYGPEAVAGFGVAMRIEGVALALFFAMSATIGPFAGQNLGAGHPQRITEAIHESTKLCQVWGLMMAGVLGLLAPSLVRVFSDVPAVVESGSWYLRIVPVSYGAAGVVMVIKAAFNGVGRPLPAVGVSVLRSLILYVPAAYVGAQLAGLAGVFVAAGLANLVGGAGAYIWFQRYFRCTSNDETDKRSTA